MVLRSLLSCMKKCIVEDCDEQSEVKVVWCWEGS